MLVPVENLMRDGIVYAAEIALPECIGINKDGSAFNIDIALVAFEQIINMGLTRREAYLAEDAEVISNAVTLDYLEPSSSATRLMATRMRTARW